VGNSFGVSWENDISIFCRICIYLFDTFFVSKNKQFYVYYLKFMCSLFYVDRLIEFLFVQPMSNSSIIRIFFIGCCLTLLSASHDGAVGSVLLSY
jgi:hypothetical protein